MSRIPMLTLVVAGCVGVGPPPPSDSVIEGFEQSPTGGAYHIKTIHLWGGHETRSANHPGPRPLRSVVDRLAGCGQAEDDVLHVQVFVIGWPWTVVVVEATPGAESCIADLISQLPLDTDLGPASVRLVESRTTVAALRAPSPEDEPPRACTLSSQWLAGQMSTSVELEDPAAVALAVTCGSATPLTALTLRYLDGALAEVTTVPPVACVEQAARERFQAISDVGLDYRQNTPIGEWDSVICTLPVPLRAD